MRGQRDAKPDAILRLLAQVRSSRTGLSFASPSCISSQRWATRPSVDDCWAGLPWRAALVRSTAAAQDRGCLGAMPTRPSERRQSTNGEQGGARHSPVDTGSPPFLGCYVDL
eukprot:1075437-Pyramimonas_sp.AAC.1